MGIRAKFKVVRVSKFEGGGEGIELAAVYGPENEPWSKYTPSGNLQMVITNPSAMGQFEPGRTYFLDLAPAD